MGGVDGHGLAAVFDPDGPDAGRFAALTPLAGGAEADATPVRVVVDGEIFNLRRLAEQLGLPAGSPAEEVVSAGYGRWSRDVLARLRGSFALAVVDEARGRALIAADQVGGHSIYYHANGRRLTVASEIQPLLRLLPARPAPDPVGFVHWFSDDPAPLGRTLYAGVEELPGGECIELSASGWRRWRYWQPRYEPFDPGLSQGDAAELLWVALVDAVGSRLGVSDRIGLVISGGVDSAAVAAAAVAAAGGRRLGSYSVVFPGYPDDRVDETERIQQLVAALDLDSTQVLLEPGGSFALSLDWLRRWDVPLGGPGYLLERALLQLAATAGVDAVLDGQGGDEGFAVSPFWLADLLRRGRLVASVQMARRLPDGSASLRGLLEAWQEHALLGVIPAAVHEAVRRRRDPYGNAPSFLTPEQARLHVETDHYWSWKRRRGVPAWWAERAFLVTADRQAIGMGDYLRRRAAVAGLRARPPLLDPDLVECLLRIPPRLGFDPTFNRVLIRKALAGRVPDAVRLSTRKSHLGPFFFDIVGGPDLAPIRRVLGRPDLELGGYVKVDAVRGMIDDPPAPTDPARVRWLIDVWRLVTAECWLRYQEDRSLVDALLDTELPQPRWTTYGAMLGGRRDPE